MESRRAGAGSAVSPTGGGSPPPRLRGRWHKSRPSCALDAEAPRTPEQLEGSPGSLTISLRIWTLGRWVQPGGAWRADWTFGRTERQKCRFLGSVSGPGAVFFLPPVARGSLFHFTPK